MAILERHLFGPGPGNGPGDPYPEAVPARFGQRVPGARRG